MSRKAKVLVAGLVAIAALAVAPAANAEPNKVCPSQQAGWFLTPPSSGDTVVDRNDDGLICVKAVNGRGSSRDVPGFTVRDDLISL
jgi:hypothetical protein